jgi:hypothetical protein
MLRRANNKKGMFIFESVMWIMRSVILVFVLLSLIFVTSQFIVNSIDTRTADSLTVMNLFYYSEKGTAFKDETVGRIYPGWIDVSRDSLIDSRIDFGTEAPIASRVTVVLSDGTEKEFFYDSEKFEDGDFLFRAGLTGGIGGARKTSSEKIAIARKEGSGEKVSASVKTEVVTKNA